MKDKILKCEGNCDEHIGEIKKVEVVEFPFKNWGEFYYCETAIKKDESNGFIINIK